MASMSKALVIKPQKRPFWSMTTTFSALAWMKSDHTRCIGVSQRTISGVESSHRASLEPLQSLFSRPFKGL